MIHQFKQAFSRTFPPLVLSLVLLTTTSYAGDFEVDSVLRSLIGPFNFKNLNIDSIEISLFPGVTFYEADTVLHKRHPVLNKQLFRFACDSSGRVFRLSGFDRQDYDSLVQQFFNRPVIDTLYQLGKVFAERNLPYGLYPYHFVNSVDEFIELNEQIKAAESASPSEERWNEILNEINCLHHRLARDRMAYDLSGKEFHAQYYFWNELGGDLYRVNLLITEHLEFKIESSYVIMRELGWYTTIVL